MDDRKSPQLEEEKEAPIDKTTSKVGVVGEGGVDDTQISMETHEEIMRIALETAEEGYQAREVAVGAVFVRFTSPTKYEILAKAHNLTNLTGNVPGHILVSPDPT